MSTDLVATFEESLAGLDVTWSHTAPDGFEATVAAAVERPAVGAPLGLDEVSLDGTDVTVQPTPAELETARTGVSAAGLGIAERGTLVIQSRPGGDEPVSLYPERHVAVLRESDLVASVGDALGWLGEEFAAGRDSAVFATGVSATGDMGELVQGVHGPKEVHVVVVES
jgi:L-lactate dehydrogenase complex protein LldG